MDIRKLMVTAALGAGISMSPAAFANEQSKQSVGESISEYASDTMLTTKIKAAIVAEKELSALDISLETTDGVVTLSGPVGSDKESEQAETVTRAVEGVKDVHNKLRVEAAPAR